MIKYVKAVHTGLKPLHAGIIIGKVYQLVNDMSHEDFIRRQRDGYTVAIYYDTSSKPRKSWTAFAWRFVPFRLELNKNSIVI